MEGVEAVGVGGPSVETPGVGLALATKPESKSVSMEGTGTSEVLVAIMVVDQHLGQRKGSNIVV